MYMQSGKYCFGRQTTDQIKRKSAGINLNLRAWVQSKLFARTLHSQLVGVCPFDVEIMRNASRHSPAGSSPLFHERLSYNRRSCHRNHYFYKKMYLPLLKLVWFVEADIEKKGATLEVISPSFSARNPHQMSSLSYLCRVAERLTARPVVFAAPIKYSYPCSPLFEFHNNRVDSWHFGNDWLQDRKKSILTFLCCNQLVSPQRFSSSNCQCVH